MSARWRAEFFALAAAFAFAGCGSSALTAANCDGGDPSCPTHCGRGIDSPPDEGRTHVPIGSTVNYVANPPASGNHYPVWWTPWGLTTQLVQREYWVHNLEHGGIVLLYNCPSGCTDVVDQLVAIRNGTPPDQFNEQRILITADGKMPHKVAALAWDWRWQGDSVDAAAINCFIKARYDHGLESIP
ncbi:MAG TPA: DUF3105 domain-containing protein [Polyangia bacterium]|nr:DUF3105 domain-containing protein [Polyangia bacterium]